MMMTMDSGKLPVLLELVLLSFPLTTVVAYLLFYKRCQDSSIVLKTICTAPPILHAVVAYGGLYLGWW